MGININLQKATIVLGVIKTVTDLKMSVKNYIALIRISKHLRETFSTLRCGEILLYNIPKILSKFINAFYNYVDKNALPI